MGLILEKYEDSITIQDIADVLAEAQERNQEEC